jgi:hypothetical protein
MFRPDKSILKDYITAHYPFNTYVTDAALLYVAGVKHDYVIFRDRRKNN